MQNYVLYRLSVSKWFSRNHNKNDYQPLRPVYALGTSPKGEAYGRVKTLPYMTLSIKKAAVRLDSGFRFGF